MNTIIHIAELLEAAGSAVKISCVKIDKVIVNKVRKSVCVHCF